MPIVKRNPGMRRNFSLLRNREMNSNIMAAMQKGRKYFKAVKLPDKGSPEKKSWRFPKKRKITNDQAENSAAFPLFRYRKLLPKKMTRLHNMAERRNTNISFACSNPRFILTLWSTKKRMISTPETAARNITDFWC